MYLGLWWLVCVCMYMRVYACVCMHVYVYVYVCVWVLLAVIGNQDKLRESIVCLCWRCWNDTCLTKKHLSCGMYN
jgi:hypothetical protein